MTTFLCAAGTANVTGKTLHAELTLNPVLPATAVFPLNVYPDLFDSTGGLFQVDADRFFTSTLTWKVTNLGSIDAARLTFEIDVTAAYTGTVYLDNVSIK